MDADHQVVGVALSDESTANGIPDLFVDEIVLPVEGLESHAVGMGRHAVPYIHHHIASVIEIDAMRAVEHQLAACLAFHTDIAHVIGIDGFRYVAFQARHRGAIGTVPKTGQGEANHTVPFARGRPGSVCRHVQGRQRIYWPRPSVLRCATSWGRRRW